MRTDDFTGRGDHIELVAESTSKNESLEKDGYWLQFYRIRGTQTELDLLTMKSKVIRPTNQVHPVTKIDGMKEVTYYTIYNQNETFVDNGRVGHPYYSFENRSKSAVTIADLPGGLLAAWNKDNPRRDAVLYWDSVTYSFYSIFVYRGKPLYVINWERSFQSKTIDTRKTYTAQYKILSGKLVKSSEDLPGVAKSKILLSGYTRILDGEKDVTPKDPRNPSALRVRGDNLQGKNAVYLPNPILREHRQEKNKVDFRPGIT